jgi:hypothetical protein
MIIRPYKPSRAWVSPGGFRRADDSPPVHFFGANAPQSDFSRTPPGVSQTPRPAKPQHFVIPGLTRNPEAFSPARMRRKNLIDELDSGSSPE